MCSLYYWFIHTYICRCCVLCVYMSDWLVRYQCLESATDCPSSLTCQCVVVSYVLSWALQPCSVYVCLKRTITTCYFVLNICWLKPSLFNLLINSPNTEARCNNGYGPRDSMRLLFPVSGWTVLSWSYELSVGWFVKVLVGQWVEVVNCDRFPCGSIFGDTL
mgnify:CR=1 FL=1